MNKLFFYFAFLSCYTNIVMGQVISRSFEMRYFTKDPKANGETDFKGPTDYLNTAQRIEFLKHYADYAKQYFNDPHLDTRVVNIGEVKEKLRQIKPQPQPLVRTRLPLTEWKCLGYTDSEYRIKTAQFKKWSSDQNIIMQYGALIFKHPYSLNRQFLSQSWRFFIQFDIRLPDHELAGSFMLNDSSGRPVCKIKFEHNKLYYSSGQVFKAGNAIIANQTYTLKIEPDLENKKYNLYVDDSLIADFVPIINNYPVKSLTIKGGAGMSIDNLWGVGYQKSVFTRDNHSRDIPFTIHTFIDEDFERKPEIAGWQQLAYDDRGWKTERLPYANGGERHAAEDLYLRKTVRAGDFKKAFLNIETLDPGGEIWINGKVVDVVHNRHPLQLDVTAYILKNQDNIIAIRVYPNKVLHTNRHTPSDKNTGWFSGRIFLDLTSDKYISDVFSYTDSIGPVAIQKVIIKLKNEDWQYEEREMKGTREFKGFVIIKAYQWFPVEGVVPVATNKIPVDLNLYRDVELNGSINIPHPDLWSADSPHLYKLTVTLEDQKGKAVDDEVITTGIRTISQQGGTFRINGIPAMMNGAMLFGYKAPLDKIAQWLRGGPDEELIKELITLKKLNGNTIRMSIHDGVDGASNDPRLAEYADQLGIMFQWTTGSWVRTGSPWYLDWEGLPEYIKQVRNHPSIVMWQVANHPVFGDFRTETYPWLCKLYQLIYSADPSRLISPSANSSRMLYLNDEGTSSIDHHSINADSFKVWTAPMMTRGDMDFLTGYSNDWRVIRLYPHPPDWNGEQGWISNGFRVNELNSKSRAYFDFESEESIGQPNWELMKGKPMYHIMSYEIQDYDDNTIGRQLNMNEWQLSQAWQAFSGFEAYKKKRWLDYDGMVWCTLDGGGNTGTYLKPLTDYYGHAKLAFHTIKMAFQKTLAGSYNVDMVYGPNDTLKPVVMHLGDSLTADVTVRVKDMEEKVVDERKYAAVKLDGGRTVKELPAFIPKVAKDGFYVFEYVIQKTK